jgi:O-antigen/teichoic acid export membrane protein
MSNINKFIIHFMHFFIGNISTLILGFITFPILTRMLNESQYGILGLVTNTASLAVAFAKAGLSEGIIRIYNEYRGTIEQRNIFSSTVVIRGIIFSSIAVVAYILLVPFLMPSLKIQSKYLSCFMIMSVYLFIRPLNLIGFSLMRANEETLIFNIATFIGKVTSVGLSLLLLIYIIKGLYGFFVGTVLSELLLALILAAWFFSKFKVNITKVSKKLTNKLIIFGIPLLLIETLYLILSYFDRYMILYYCGEQSLGIYTVGYNLAMYIGNIMGVSIGYAVVPIYVRIFEEEGRIETEKFLSKSLDYLMIAIIPICIGYYAISKELIVFLASEKYALSADVSVIILIGTINLALINIINAGLYLKKKTMIILLIMMIAVFINIILNYIFLPMLGIKGSAFAFLLSSTCAMLLTIIFAFKYIKIKLNIINVMYYLLLSGGMYAVINVIFIKAIWISLITKISVGILISSVGVLIKEKQLRLKIMSLITAIRLKIE